VSSDLERVEGIRDAIDRFLSLLDAGTGSPSGNALELAASLDGLAWSVRLIPASSSLDGAIDRPEVADDTMLRKIPERFPDFGHYTLVDPVEPGDVDPEVRLGDALDDVSDIARDLLRVRQIWDEVGEAEALWELRFSFESHWEYHLRHLQLYLLQRLSPFWGT